MREERKIEGDREQAVKRVHVKGGWRKLHIVELHN
jgi:hypothetical protein